MKNFNDLNLSPEVLRALTEMGFEKPSPIQAEALPLLLEGPTDFLGLAATGTGKTAAFAIPLIERIDPQAQGVQALVLCPTRELALQVSGQIELIGKHKGVKCVAIYGGAGYGDQIRGIRRGAQVVIATPGRLVDHLEQGTISFEALSTLVLDEADEMISMGFKEDLESILENSPEECSTWLFSATMGHEVQGVADDYLHEPKKVQVNRTEMLPESIEQVYYATRESDKPEVLCKLIDAADDLYGLIFFQTKALVADLTNYLRGRGYAVDCLHGDMDQNARERTMRAFRERKVNILLCTDVAARGLDVKDVTHVVNYSIPRELDNYVHRIGRTARSGKSGIAMSLVTPTHRGLIVRIERMTQRKFSEGKIPTRKEIGARKVARILDAFKSQASHAKAVELMDSSWREAIAAMTSEEIAGRFLAMMYPEVFCERDEAEKLRTSANPQAARAERGEKREFGAGYGKPRGEKREFGAGNGRSEKREFGAGYARSEKREFGAGYGKPRGEKREFGAGYGKPRGEKREFGAGYARSEKREFGAGYGKPRGEKREFGAGYGKPRDERQNDRQGDRRDEQPAFRGFRKERVLAAKPKFMGAGSQPEGTSERKPKSKSNGFVSSI